MRTTISLDPDVSVLVRARARSRRIPVEQVVNETLRERRTPRSEASPFETPTFDLGGASVPLDRALVLAGSLEDAERLRDGALGR